MSALRIIIRTDSASMAANVGGSVHTEFKTFDISAPEVEKFLKGKIPDLSHRYVVGVELLDEAVAS